jgi:hypothetical protein
MRFIEKEPSMKQVALILLAAAVALSARAAEERPFNPEIAGFANLYLPADDDTYEVGAGMEAQVRLWLHPKVGVAFAIGGASYAIDEQEIEFVGRDVAVDASFEGDVSLAPIGLSLLLKPVKTETLSLTLEAGVRYVMVESYAEIEIDSVQPGLRTIIDDEVDIDDGIVAVALLQLEYRVGRQISLVGGAGYQFDLEKGDVEFLDEDLGENELEAALIQAGLIIRF